MTRRPRIRALAGLWRGEGGHTAAEFALVLPALVMMSIGVINLGVVLWGVASLHYATEDAARWCMINSSSCTTASLNTYAQTRYTGPLVSPVFTLSAATCDATAAVAGEQVTGVATFKFSTGLTSTNLPITAIGCRPLG